MEHKEKLHKEIDAVFHKVPEQGPLNFFIHHNTLHHYENMNFFDAVKVAAVEFDANAFMSEAFYQHKYELGMIDRDILHSEISHFIKRHHLSLSDEILWELLFTNTLKSGKDVNQSIAGVQKQYSFNKPIFFSQAIKDDLGIDIDFHTSATVYRFMSAYFDYGIANWKIKNRDKGMWYHFCELHKHANFLESRYRKNLSQLIKTHCKNCPIESIESIIASLGIDQNYIDAFLFQTCIKHKGWAGFVKSLILHPEYIKTPDIKPDYFAFLAIVILCDYAAILTFMEPQKSDVRFEKIPKHNATFLAKYFGMIEKHPEQAQALTSALPYLTDFNRQEIFHKAYEQALYDKFLCAFSSNKKPTKPLSSKYQAICCMDDREESFRRYLEINPDCETFGCAGHFGLNIQYKGFFDKRYRALCPINVTPEYDVTEHAKHINRFKLRIIHWLGDFKWLTSVGTKSAIGSVFISLLLGAFGIFSFLLDIINPRIVFDLKQRSSSFLKSAVTTELVYDIPFKKRVDFAESLLKLIGLKNHFSSYVFIVGHGSMSLNNPHRAAYDCGACGGGIGAVNARLIAKILNEHDVRESLIERNVIIPESTLFIGAYHNTCSDEVEFFDYPSNAELEKILQEIRHAALLESQERSRRFSNLPLKRTPNYYIKQVQARAYDMRQPRPEYGHSTNALLIVGPRAYTHPLFLDRRAFLLSYEPEQDHDAVILNTLLSAVLPVVTGINLEYYFSYIDNEFYGAGTKLPHNVNGLVGVMNGHLSDLRPGLPWQMVEIHQPVRLYVTLVADLSHVKKLLIENEILKRLTCNQWINLAVHDIQTDGLWVYQNGEFVRHHSTHTPPIYFPHDQKILSTRDHLDFGKIFYGK